MEIEVSVHLEDFLDSSVKEGKGVWEKEFEKERRFRSPSGTECDPYWRFSLISWGHLKTEPVPLA